MLYHAIFSIYFFPEALTVWDVTFNSINKEVIVMRSTVANHTPASLATRKPKRARMYEYSAIGHKNLNTSFNYLALYKL